jgi:hypothetical protein
VQRSVITHIICDVLVLEMAIRDRRNFCKATISWHD